MTRTKGEEPDGSFRQDVLRAQIKDESDHLVSLAHI
jgi:hypothetical protein